MSSFLVGTCGRQVLLDCGLNMKALVHLPLQGPYRFHGPSLHAIDVDSIDYVVISNHLSLLGLPLLTERTSFKVNLTQRIVGDNRLGCDLCNGAMRALWQTNAPGNARDV